MAPVLAVSFDWILQNLEYVAPIVIFIIYNFLNRERPEEGPAESEMDAPPRSRPAEQPAGDGLTDEQRADRVREEIRRKIAERMGGGTAPSAPIPPPIVVAQPVPPPMPEPAYLDEPEVGLDTWNAPEPEEAPVASAPARSIDMNGLAEQFRKLDEARRAAELSVVSLQKSAYLQGGSKGAKAGLGERRPLREELRDPAGLRRAIILREVLDRPVSLR